MTVGELMEMLSGFPRETRVGIRMYSFDKDGNCLSDVCADSTDIWYARQHKIVYIVGDDYGQE